MIINHPDVVAKVREQVLRYEKALISNDIKELDELFWDSPYTVRLGGKENLFGYSQIQAFRQGRASRGLDRTIEQISIVAFGSEMACAHVIFSRRGEPLGRQTQTWVKLEGVWRVVSAHVSAMMSDCSTA
ncbi:oxalurate catabolism protein HpxZ [Celerinatantimonas yamalensis]|uniref:Oxalurate catabolism protein HpxZ n=1 Tax=Celerinatantimonas yamalensis TaxID=559956 RepID=A0ABW9GAE7_9GAMM